MAVLTMDGVACSAPDGTSLFSQLNLSVGEEVVGIVGRNGAGKSTLLHAIVGDQPVTAGAIRSRGKTGLLRQQPLDPASSVADVLGVRRALARLNRIGGGEGTADDHEGADWGLPSRLELIFASVGLPPLEPTRLAATLSGGERTRLMLAALVLPEPDIILLDEPTNNLDDAGREAVLAFLQQWNGPALIASHDRELLRCVDRIVELTNARVHVVGGGWDAFDGLRMKERMRAAEAEEKAEAELKASRRAWQRESERQARRDKRGRAVAARAIDPKIYLHAQQQRAERTAARHRGVRGELVSRANDNLEEARAKVERVVPIRIELPQSGLPAHHVLVDARGVSVERGGRTLFASLDFSVIGPERIALAGPNGSGKTSLIRTILGLDAPSSGTIASERERMALLDQDLTLVGSAESLIDAMQRHNPAIDRRQAHEALAAYGFRNNLAHRAVATLSGGERVRLALACLFSRPEPPQMLILDEPTNHLDLAATEQLETALNAYDGAILCVSHDSTFRSALGISKEITLPEASERSASLNGNA